MGPHPLSPSRGPHPLSPSPPMSRGGTTDGFRFPSPRGRGDQRGEDQQGERRTDFVSPLPKGEGIKGVRTYRRGNTWVSTRRLLYVSTNRRWIASVGNASSAP